MTILAWIVLGLVAGWLAGIVVNLTSGAVGISALASLLVAGAIFIGAMRGDLLSKIHRRATPDSFPHSSSDASPGRPSIDESGSDIQLTAATTASDSSLASLNFDDLFQSAQTKLPELPHDAQTHLYKLITSFMSTQDLSNTR